MRGTAPFRGVYLLVLLCVGVGFLPSLVFILLCSSCSDSHPLFYLTISLPSTPSNCPFAYVLFIEFYDFFEVCDVASSAYLPHSGKSPLTLGRVGAPLTVVHPSQNSGRAAFPHPALCETNRSHYHSYIFTYILGLTSR